MELPESTKTDEQLKPIKPKRRLSSILKTPRTPLKCIGADNEDCQEEATKPIEKKRNSRRVSFASTNDIHVFVKDFKNGSPVENLLQDLSATGEDMLDDKEAHTVKDAGLQIVGMETLLNAPLQLSQHHNKENIFNCGVQKDFCNKTVVFSEEDAAFMDMTHSHTICIDDCKTRSAGFDGQRWDDGTLLKSCSTSGKGQIEESELEDFLASLSQSSDSVKLSRNPKSTHLTTLFPSISSPAPKVDSKDFFARLHARRYAVDQENQVPDASRKSLKHDGFSQKQTLCFNDKTVLSIEQENMDLTKSHTATIDNKALFKVKSLALSEEQDDMEMTRSHTVFMESKACHVVNSSASATRSVSCMSTSNKPIIFSEADSVMEMTGAFTGNIEENNRNSSTKRVWLFPAINTISRAGQTDVMESLISPMDVKAKNGSLWPAASSDSQDMEMTRSQTVVIDSKNCMVIPPSLGKESTVNSLSRMSAQNKTVMVSANHDMDMTDIFTGRIVENICVPTCKDETLARLSATKTVQFSDKPNCMGEKQNETAAVGHRGVWAVMPSDPYDMEMTRSQTVVIDSKNCPMNPSLEKARRSVSYLSAPNKTVIFSEEGHDMEMTGAFTGNIEENTFVPTSRDEMLARLSTTTRTAPCSGKLDCKGRKSQTIGQSDVSVAVPYNSDDMEMTRSQTVVIDSKNCPINPSLDKARSSVSFLSAPSKTVMFSEEDHDMEMTGAFTGNIEENTFVPTSRDEMLARLSTTAKTAPFSGKLDCKGRKSQTIGQSDVSVAVPYNSDDMEMTRSQTVVIDSKNCPINPSLDKARSSVSFLSAPSKTVIFSEEGHDMEMTGAFTGNIEENTFVPTSRDEMLARLSTTTKTAPFSGKLDCKGRKSQTIGQSDVSVAVPYNSDDMEMTRSQTVVIDSKNCPINPSLDKARSSVSFLSAPSKTIMFSEEDHDMEMTGAFTGNIEENTFVPTSRDEMLARLSTTTKTAPFSGKLDCKGRKSQTIGQSDVSVAVPYNSDDMEMTRSQTVVIDSKNCPINPSLYKARSSVSFLSAPSKTVIFSEEGHDMEMTGAFTGNIEENTFVPTSRDEMLARLSTTTKTAPFSGKLDCKGRKSQTIGQSDVSVAVPYNSDDMEMTRSQTVVIDSKQCPINPSLDKARSSVSFLSAPNKTVMFSEEDHDMEMTGAITGRIEENRNASTERDETGDCLFPATNTISHFSQTEKITRCSSQMDDNVLNRLCPAILSEPDDMEMTRSQAVVIDSKNCSMNPSLGKARRSVSYLSAPNETFTFSEEHDIELTGDFTGNIKENTCSPTSRDEMLARLSAAKTVGHRGVCAALSSDPNDMEMGRSQTVVIDSKYCGTAKPSLGSVRKSLSCLSGFSKTLMFPTGYSGMEVPKVKHVQTGGSDTVAKWPPTTQDLIAYDESEATGRAHSQIATSDPDCMQSRSQTLSDSKSGEQINYLLSMSGNKLCMSTSNKAQIYPEEDNGRGGTGAFTGFSVKNGQNGEMANTSVSTRTKCVPHQSASLIYECDQGIETEENRPATTDEEGKQVCSLSKTNTVSPPDLPNHQAECINTGPIIIEGITGPYDQRAFEGITLFPAELAATDEKSCDVFLEDCTVADDEGRSCTTNLGDSLVIDPSEKVYNGKGSVKRAKSRRLSLADLQSKLKNIGHMITEQSDLRQVCHTAPVLQLITASLPEAKETSVEDCLLTVDPVVVNPSDCISGAISSMTLENSKSDRQTNMTEPLNPLRSKSQVARLSLGVFLPKLPRRSKPIDPYQEDPTAPSNFRTLLRKSRAVIMQERGDSSEVENIHEETLPEMNSEEDLSETVEGEFLGENRDQEAGLGQAVNDEMFAEPVRNVTQGQKRSCPVDGHEDDMLEERKIRSSAMPSRQLEPSKCAVQWDSNVAGIVGENPPSFMTKTLDSTNFSSDSPSQRCEGTFETSAYRSSQYDIQFDEAYEMDLQQKLENGSITMREFLKLFGIDFNIHRPRQSVLPDNFETNHNSEAILLEKHVNRPKQRVYEEDCQELTKLVEKLKTRMRDQDSTLKTANESLWETMKTCSEEQLQSFGRKLKERKVCFRKKSKAFSHELKIGLYSRLVHTTLVAQQNLTEKIEDTDELLKHLDECLNDLDAELASMDCAGVEENSATSETELTLQVKQQELETLNMALAENDRRTCELELEKSNTKGKVRRLQDETLELEKQVTVLDRLIEWRLSEQTDERAAFTFLYDSMGLEVLFEKPASETTAGAAETEQNVADITFQLGLDAETSQCYARLVHSLIGQFIQSETCWVQRYPTRRHIPMLLHDVALVVSRCRLLGEEIHRLQKWGSLKLDILEISCVDIQVTILFSSLKATAKFELTLAVTPSYPLTELQLINFKNYIGNTRFDQVEEIISTETPAKNYLTRIVKKIHNVLLC